MLKTLVKISTITNLSDARYCAGMGVEMLGFDIDANSPKYITPQTLTEIKGWLAGVKIVGETQLTDIKAIKSLTKAYPLDIIQISDASLLAESSALGLPIILQISNPSSINLEKYAPFVSHFLINTTDINGDELSKICSQYAVLLNFNESLEQLEYLLEQTKPLGFNFVPANFDDLRDTLEALEVED